MAFTFVCSFVNHRGNRREIEVTLDDEDLDVVETYREQGVDDEAKLAFIEEACALKKAYWLAPRGFSAAGPPKRRLQ
jgi:hypothetical protein